MDSRPRTLFSNFGILPVDRLNALLCDVQRTSTSRARFNMFPTDGTSMSDTLARFYTEIVLLGTPENTLSSEASQSCSLTSKVAASSRTGRQEHADWAAKVIMQFGSKRLRTPYSRWTRKTRFKLTFCLHLTAPASAALDRGTYIPSIAALHKTLIGAREYGSEMTKDSVGWSIAQDNVHILAGDHEINSPAKLG
ncbi:hypothetical protein C8T65DRAFT_738604 [Cerioporus squamosus]|nr:hypothetical protein C8T65DRAFT_738604 [Cerioporus squamosus]